MKRIGPVLLMAIVWPVALCVQANPSNSATGEIATQARSIDSGAALL
jgi:hypothetical protein